MKFEKEYLNAIVNIVLGAMFIIFRGSVVSIAITFLGIVAILLGVIDFVNKQTTFGIIKCTCGVAVLVFGRIFLFIACVIIGFALIAMGAMRIVDTYHLMPVNATATEKIMSYLKPFVSIAAGLCLIFNFGDVVDWLLIVAGALLIVDGVLSFIAKAKKQ